ncbi:DgyrCDS11362 [Dimorphilus gyrociliatus]|uniref:DgyrCDS11362 n=1 Tax=Dimorphilus gyrociliatus TaxID=2664684 RepID=A0A7I8W332_9ANNE|nr:DgyrCDS11362 [Dimorphilus gyrociliatus]
MSHDRTSPMSSIYRLQTDRRGYIDDLASRTSSIMSFTSVANPSPNELKDSDELELRQFLEEEDKELAKLLSYCDDMKKSRVKNEEKLQRSSSQNLTNSPHSVIVRRGGRSSTDGVVAYESLGGFDKNLSNTLKIDIPDVPKSKKEKPKLPLVTNPYTGVHLEFDQEERTQEADYRLLRTKWSRSYAEVTGAKRGMGAVECILPQLPVLNSNEVKFIRQKETGEPICLGSGSRAACFLGEFQNHTVCVKIYNNANVVLVVKEAKMMQHLYQSDPNIAPKFFGFIHLAPHLEHPFVSIALVVEFIGDYERQQSTSLQQLVDMEQARRAAGTHFMRNVEWLALLLKVGTVLEQVHRKLIILGGMRARHIGLKWKGFGYDKPCILNVFRARLLSVSTIKHQKDKDEIIKIGNTGHETDATSMAALVSDINKALKLGLDEATSHARRDAPLNDWWGLRDTIRFLATRLNAALGSEAGGDRNKNNTLPSKTEKCLWNKVIESSKNPSVKSPLTNFRSIDPTSADLSSIQSK